MKPGGSGDRGDTLRYFYFLDPKNRYLKFVLYLKHIFEIENELDDIFFSEFEDNIKGKVFNFIMYK